MVRIFLNSGGTSGTTISSNIDVTGLINDQTWRLLSIDLNAARWNTTQDMFDLVLSDLDNISIGIETVQNRQSPEPCESIEYMALDLLNLNLNQYYFLQKQILVMDLSIK